MIEGGDQALVSIHLAASIQISPAFQGGVSNYGIQLASKAL